MHRIFNNPSLLFHDGALDQTAYGMVAQKSEAFDANFVDDVSRVRLMEKIWPYTILETS